jgi:hypothetical protein
MAPGTHTHTHMYRKHHATRATHAHSFTYHPHHIVFVTDSLAKRNNKQKLQ